MPTAGSEKIDTYQNILYISTKPNPLPLPEVCVVLFLCGQKAKILSNTTAHFFDYNVVQTSATHTHTH